MLKLKIVTPEKIFFEGNVENVVVPGTVGQFEILEHHAPIVSSLEKGTVSYKADGVEQTLDIVGGFVSVKKNLVSVCVEV